MVLSMNMGARIQTPARILGVGTPDKVHTPNFQKVLYTIEPGGGGGSSRRRRSSSSSGSSSSSSSSDTNLFAASATIVLNVLLVLVVLCASLLCPARTILQLVSRLMT